MVSAGAVPALMKSNGSRAALAWSMALASCTPSAPDRVRAGDAGFVYRPEVLEPTAPTGMRPADLARPSIDLIAGEPGGRGDLDGIGPEARLGLVGGMTRVDSTVVFADEGNGSLRRFTPRTRAVDTIVTLPAGRDGRPSLPASVAYDGHGRVYVTDRARSVVYAFDLATRALAIVAGIPGERGESDGAAPRALFDTPTGLAFDGDHTLFIADTGNRSIRRIDLERGAVSTLARGFAQVWGLCFSGGVLYATDVLTAAVFEVNPESGASTPIAGSNRFGYAGPTDGAGVSARLREPRGIACTGDRLYVADRGNALVRAIGRTDHRVETLAGRAGFCAVRDGERDGARFDDVQTVLVWDDALYVGDTAAIRMVSPPVGGVVTVAGTPDRRRWPQDAVIDATMARPEGVAWVATEGAAYVAECRSAVIRRVDLATRQISVFAGDFGTGGFVDGPSDLARFACPSAMAYDGRGNLFVGDHDNHAIRSVHVPTRRVVTLAGYPTRCANDDGPFETATFCEPAAIAVAGAELFVADASTSTIRRVDLNGRTVSTLAGVPFAAGWSDGVGQAARFSAPSSVLYRDGILLVADTRNDAVRRIDVRTGAVTTLAGAPGQAANIDGPFSQTRMDEPRGLAWSGADGVLVLDRHAVRRLSLSTGVSVHVVDAGRGLRTGEQSPQFSWPAAAVESGPGEALVVDRTENVLVRLSVPMR